MPKKSAKGKTSTDAERLTLELTRKLKKPRARAASPAPAVETPPAVASEPVQADPPARSGDAVAELMKRYDRSRPRMQKTAGEDDKE